MTLHLEELPQNMTVKELAEDRNREILVRFAHLLMADFATAEHGSIPSNLAPRRVPTTIEEVLDAQWERHEPAIRYLADR